MIIDHITIKNFKCFGDPEFTLPLKPGTNIIVGNNESGKTTILEAIHLATRGVFRNSRINRYEINEYMFNKAAVDKYKGEPKYDNLPEIVIELYLNEKSIKDSRDINVLSSKGSNNSERHNCHGVSLIIAPIQDLKEHYNRITQKQNEVDQSVITIPIEYYGVIWKDFADKPINAHAPIIKSVSIDNRASYRKKPSDIYVSQLIEKYLQDDPENQGSLAIARAYREMKESFIKNKTIQDINSQMPPIKDLEENISLSADLSNPNDWEKHLVTLIGEIPLPYIGSGWQSIIKTTLAINEKKAKNASVVLFEEPENNLSHSNLNKLIKLLDDTVQLDTGNNQNEQIIITTHSSFVANKLGLDKITILNKNINKHLPNSDAYKFFKKLPGYNTLRIVLCEKVILVEGPSDELIVQKAYQEINNGELPIENGIEVISVGNSALRFLEMVHGMKKTIAVVIDRDNNDPDILRKRYSEFTDNKEDNIKLFFGEEEGKTLEPCIISANKDGDDMNRLKDIIGHSESIEKYMTDNKTDYALKIFDSEEYIKFPKYILDAIEHIS